MNSNKKEYSFVFDESNTTTSIEQKAQPACPPPPLLKEQELPVAAYKDVFLKAVQDHPVIVVVGDTGSGKTTQLPQYLLEAGIIGKSGHDDALVCTQPRRVAAMSVSLGDQFAAVSQLDHPAVLLAPPPIHQRYIPHSVSAISPSTWPIKYQLLKSSHVPHQSLPPHTHPTEETASTPSTKYHLLHT